MKLIHTADWHLGQTFFGYDRKAEHLCFLKWLKDKLKELSINGLLIAGDVFDSPNPSAESQKMFYQFLKETTTELPELQIIITAGNHDSAARLEAPNPLLEGMSVTVKGNVKRTPEGDIDYENLIVPLYIKRELAAWILAVPYLRQGDYPEAENYPTGVKQLYENLCNYIPEKSVPIIAMGHLQATGSEISENDRSERTIIGGLECISPESFSKDIAYTALGHLHRAQQVSGRENIRYSGTPLPMSFAEKRNRQGVNLIEIKENIHIQRIEFQVPVKLLSIPPEPKPLPEIFVAIASLPEGEIHANSPYLEIKVLITEPEPSLKYQIESALKTKSVRLARIVPVTIKQEGKEKKFNLMKNYNQLIQWIWPLTFLPIDSEEKICRNQLRIC